ncbi:hypothetical protein [Leptolyngbya ohadii]|uniref:hypothetical protein n=1 Tax=Leptolyngbya ohadii TaxID=1962290 RepID=UPI000B599253|nr:hypothetical protein [Leptolyngbya ohadii]
MPLFLVTSLYDEGISLNLLWVVEAESVEAIAVHMLSHLDTWGYFLERSFGEDLPIGIPTPAELLSCINRTFVDGDSTAQLRITPITVQSLDEVDTLPSFHPNALFSDFG